MGLKLEGLIIGLISIVLFFSYTVELKNNSQDQNNSAKELAFAKTTFIEVDVNETKGKAYSDYGVRIAGVLSLYNLKYTTNNIESLTAKSAIYQGDEIHLDDQIIIHQKKGFSYFAEHAIYNKKTEILYVTSAFTAHMNKNIVHGSSLIYDTKKREALASDIDAVVYTVEK
jgi:hypothetical protein